VGDPASGVVGAGAAELFLGHLLARDALYYVRAGNEHVARLLDHEDKVRYRRGVDGPAGARTHDNADLGHHPGGQNIPVKDVRVPRE
jgi:hypothetical protein